MKNTSKTSPLIHPSRRIKLEDRREPHWHTLGKGKHLGYRRHHSPVGSWIAKSYSSEHGRAYKALGTADDFSVADGVNVLSFDQADAAARAWFKDKEAEIVRLANGEVEETVGPYTVSQALDAYLKDRERVRRKKLPRTRSVVETHIRPSLGNTELSKLSYGKLKAWLNSVAETSPRVRRKPGVTTDTFREVDMNDPDVLRKRQATANRILTVLRAALNFAHKEGKIATKAAWERITPFGQVDVAKVRYLSVEECKRLIAVCPDDFRALVRAALYTGCRYGELIAMRAHAFNPDSDTIHVEQSKSGKGRYIPLTDEGAAFFRAATSGVADTSPMFTHADGKRKDTAWEATQQTYWMEYACEKAEITPAIGFHILRHTYASQLAMMGTPMPVIAALLGHADTRMTEKHYGHLSPSYVANTLRANLPSFGYAAA